MCNFVYFSPVKSNESLGLFLGFDPMISHFMWLLLLSIAFCHSQMYTMWIQVKETYPRFKLQNPWNDIFIRLYNFYLWQKKQLKPKRYTIYFMYSLWAQNPIRLIHVHTHVFFFISWHILRLYVYFHRYIFRFLHRAHKKCLHFWFAHFKTTVYVDWHSRLLFHYTVHLNYYFLIYFNISPL